MLLLPVLAISLYSFDHSSTSGLRYHVLSYHVFSNFCDDNVCGCAVNALKIKSTPGRKFVIGHEFRNPISCNISPVNQRLMAI